MTYTREQLDEIKKQAGLKPYERRLKGLKQLGAEYRDYCPWHEKDGHHNPSLAVYKDKNVGGAWSFACMTKCLKKKGDVFAFIQFHDHVTFSEAVRLAVEDGGVAEADAGTRGIQKPITEQGEHARQYLIDSGIPIEWGTKYCQGMVEAVVHPKLGLALGFRYDCNHEVIKYRAVVPKSRGLKFSHASGHPSDTLLYNIRHVEKEIADDSWMGAEVYVVESERDCLTMEAHGFHAVSVSSATTCIDSAGNLKIEDEQLGILARAENIFIATDQDSAGEKCADAFERCDVFNKLQIKRISWPYGGKRSGDPKDVGDLYQKDPGSFYLRMVELTSEARNRPPRWRQQFKRIAELEDAEMVQLIEGFMSEGNIGLGGLSGHGKTFLALSLVKALTTGRPFVGRFNVPAIRPVLYLCPEVGERQLRKRIKHFGVPDDEDLFLCRTLSQGPTLPLDHAHVLEAVRAMGDPVVFLDTAVRFSRGKDENSAAENQWMDLAVRGLREVGAIAVVLLHHSPKAASKSSPKGKKRKDEFVPSLENTFRGTGDIGALLDIGYNVRLIDEAPGLQIRVTCVKPRDFDPPPPFNLGLKMAARDPETGHLRSFIEELGDLAWMADENVRDITVTAREITVPALSSHCEEPDRRPMRERFEAAVTANPEASYAEIGKILNLGEGQAGRRKAQHLANKFGWSKAGGTTWTRTLFNAPAAD